MRGNNARCRLGDDVEMECFLGRFSEEQINFWLYNWFCRVLEGILAFMQFASYTETFQRVMVDNNMLLV